MPPAEELIVKAPFAGVVVSIAHGADERVDAGTPLVVLEAMKMEHEVLADADGVIASVEVAAGESVEEGQPLLVLSTAVAWRSYIVASGPRAESRTDLCGREASLYHCH